MKTLLRFAIAVTILVMAVMVFVVGPLSVTTVARGLIYLVTLAVLAIALSAFVSALRES